MNRVVVQNLLGTIRLDYSAVIQNVLNQVLFKVCLLLDCFQRANNVSKQPGARSTACCKDSIFIVLNAIEGEIRHAICQVSCIVAKNPDAPRAFER